MDRPVAENRNQERRLTTRGSLGLIAAVVLGAVAVSFVLRPAPSGSSRPEGAASSLELTDFDGTRFALASYRGKPLVVNFWASWCPSCAAEMPAFQRVYQALDGRVEFVGINNNDERTAAEELARSVGVTYRLVEDPRGELFSAFGASGMPTTVFIDAEGRVAETVAGVLTEEQLRGLIEEHLGVG